MNKEKKERSTTKYKLRWTLVIPFKTLILCLISNPSFFLQLDAVLLMKSYLFIIIVQYEHNSDEYLHYKNVGVYVTWEACAYIYDTLNRNIAMKISSDAGISKFQIRIKYFVW